MKKTQAQGVLKAGDGTTRPIQFMDTPWKRLWGAGLYRGVLGFTHNRAFHTFFLKKPIWYCAFNQLGQPLTPVLEALPNTLFQVPPQTTVTLEFTSPPPPGPLVIEGFCLSLPRISKIKAFFLFALFLLTLAMGLTSFGSQVVPPLSPTPQDIHKKRLEKHRLSLHPKGTTWAITPDVETPEQLGALAKLCQSTGLEGLKLDWQPGAALAKALPHALTPYWQLLGEPQLFLDAHNGSWALKGVRQNPESLKTTGPFLECLLGPIPDLSQNGGGNLQSVRMSLRFLELSRQKKGDSGAPNPLAATPEEAFQSLLKALSERSYAKEIASPMVISRSGETATLHVGGEIPIWHESPKSRSGAATYKPYGVQLKVTPKVLSPHTVALDFHLRVSAVDNPASPTPPSFTVREVTSRLTLQAGQVSVLGSVSLGKSAQWAQSPTPLTSIPLLKRWFTQERTTDMDAELWITLRPETLLETAYGTPGEALP